MRIRHGLILLLLVPVIRLLPAEGEPMLVFILAGQSNMVGHGVGSEFPAELKPPPTVFLFNAAQPQPLSLAACTGPEAGFAHALCSAFPSRKIGLVKCAAGGTSLYAWDPDWTKEKSKITENAAHGDLYKTLMGQVRAALKTENTILAGMVWMQGERDAKYKESAGKYAENFKAFIERVRKDLNAPDLPFVYGQISPDVEAFPFTEQVQKAQAELKLPRTSMVATQDLPRHSDKVHFDTKGQAELGKRFGEAMLKLLGEPAKK